MNPGPQAVCDGLDELAIYRCFSDSSLAANIDYVDPDLQYVVWEYQGYGSHSCPDSSNDPVRVIGSLYVEFNGFLDGPHTCFELAGCSTESLVTYSLASGPAYVAVTKASTTSVDRPDGATESQRVHLFP